MKYQIFNSKDSEMTLVIRNLVISNSKITKN